MAGGLKAIHRYVYESAYRGRDEIEWTFIFDDAGSLDITFGGEVKWDQMGDIDYSEDDDWEQVWP